MTVYEMEGFLRGKCLPGDMKVNESNAQYLVRKLSELQSQNADMAVQLANAESKCRELAAENSGLKAAFDKPQAYLSWHAIPPTWEEPLPCGEYLDVHDETGHKNSDGTDCWPVFAKPEIETPATDAFLAEVRAQGVEMFALMFAEEAIKDNNITTGWKARASRAASEYAELLREGADK
ncbi:hypothetical protein FOC46_23270 [Citrobacter portucalensis]|uniref:hypothetical protein n=1 Tax=Citrobacter portucalensis TaxID=1639133 RepID=UPI0002412F7C|nr:hypothetical protein [Citrobacter portucalensis]EHL80576.1 hypothetical protein HMPREF9428_01673 [Citrobacter portucalensis]QGS16275.1 hypothetical protein FOC46_23270 [Citrobacter portucalensis]